MFIRKTVPFMSGLDDLARDDKVGMVLLWISDFLFPRCLRYRIRDDEPWQVLVSV